MPSGYEWLAQPDDSQPASLRFHQVTSAAQDALAIRRCPDGKGAGVFALKAYAEGNLLFRERPLVAMQHAANRDHALVCGRCFAFIGSIEAQLGRRLALMLRGAEGGGDGGLRAAADALASGVLRLPHAERFHLPPGVACMGGCREEVYCSRACADADWAAHHCLLCPGPSALAEPQSSDVRTCSGASNAPDCPADGHGGPRHGSVCRSSQPGLARGAREGQGQRAAALRRFAEHAEATNDIFTLCAKVVAGTLLRARAALAAAGGSGCRHAPPRRGGTGSGPGKTAACETALRAAWAPYAPAWRAPWWACMALPDDFREAAALIADRRMLAAESLMLLREVIYDTRFPQLFALETYGAILGMFELNNMAIDVESPVEEYFLLLHVEGSGGLSLQEQAKAQKVTAPLLDALGEAWDARCEGTGLYALQSALNHACDPNAAAETRPDPADPQRIPANGDAVIVATRDIEEGEELCVSYIDQAQDLDARRADLRDYGFVCRCSRCNAEAA